MRIITAHKIHSLKNPHPFSLQLMQHTPKTSHWRHFCTQEGREGKENSSKYNRRLASNQLPSLDMSQKTLIKVSLACLLIKYVWNTEDCTGAASGTLHLLQICCKKHSQSLPVGPFPALPSLQPSARALPHQQARLECPKDISNLLRGSLGGRNTPCTCSPGVRQDTEARALTWPQAALSPALGQRGMDEAPPTPVMGHTHFPAREPHMAME